MKMASVVAVPSLIPLLLVVFSFLFLNAASMAFKIKATEDLIDRICHQTDSYDFCKKAFDSNPRTATANTAGLVQITIEQVLNNASKTLRKIQGLLYQATDETTKRNLQTCKTDYEVMLNNFEEAFKFLNLKEYDQVIKLENDVENEAVDCENLFKQLGRASPMSDVNELMSRLSQMAVVTARYLV